MSSDTDNRDRFTAPMVDAKDVFPPLVDAKAVQPLVIKDLQGSPMTFDYGRNGNRFTLAKVWKKFQDNMDFVDGDSVIFMCRRRRDNDELYVGVRRQRTLDNTLLMTPRTRRTTPSQALQEVVAAAGHAVAGEQFTVTYRSRQDSDEFIVPREVVEEWIRLRARFTPEMEVEFVWTVEDGAPPSVGPQGMITTMDDTTRMWRALEIGWIGNSKMNKRANFWQVRSVGYVDLASAAPPPPPPPKRLKSCEVAMASTSSSACNGCPTRSRISGGGGSSSNSSKLDHLPPPADAGAGAAVAEMVLATTAPLQPPPPPRAAAAAAEGSPSSSTQAQAQQFNVTRDMWLACTAPKSGRFPTVGSLVYYFPDGQAEQCPSRPPEPLPGRIFLCKVTEVNLGDHLPRPNR